MILQNDYNWIQFVIQIFASGLAMIIPIATWYIIEYLKNRRALNDLRRDFEELYKILSGGIYPDMIADVIDFMF